VASFSGIAVDGRVNTNLVPLGSDSTQIRPPCASMIVREIDRPSAVPPTRRLDAENGSNTRSWSSAAIGSPELNTETPTASSVSGGPNTWTSITPPLGANRIALDSRLPSTWASRSGSPRIAMSSADAPSTIVRCLVAAGAR